MFDFCECFHTSVYNPSNLPIKVLTFTLHQMHCRRDFILVVPPRTWKFLCWTDDVAAKVAANQLICFNLPDSVTPNDPFSSVKDMYEDLVVITSQILTDGYFELEKQVASYHWDSTEFVPMDGIQQIFGNDYTCFNIGVITRVIFNSTVPNGPIEGLQNVIELNDEISFRYIGA